MSDKLVIIDMQNDFHPSDEVTKRVVEKIEKYKSNKCKIYMTMDAHDADEYGTLPESKKYPIHCVEGTNGHALVDAVGTALALYRHDCTICYKNSFGSTELVNALLQDCVPGDKIEICGICTDICVVTNALMIRAALYKNEVYVDSSATEGTTTDAANAAFTVMRNCNIIVN